MQKTTTRNLRRSLRRGLTLVEIMVVMAILGVLMTVLGGAFMGMLDDGNVEATKLGIGKVEQALNVYAIKNRGKYPSTADGLEAAERYFGDGQVPVDAWGNPFQYYSPGTRSDADYEVISLGKDGEEGGEDADADINSWEL